MTLFRSAEWATQGKAVQWGKVRHEQPGQANDQQSSQSDKDTIRLRVNRLKDSSRELRKLAEQPIPDSLSRQEALKEKRYSEWLGQTSQELDSLAKEGSSIVKAMTIGKAKGQVSRRSSNPQEAQLLSRRTPSQSWALGSGSNVSSEGDDSNAISIIGNLTSTSSDSTGTLMDATKQMQEMNQSFNLQYLQLQQKMQSDNRQFTLMSNVMKTKHDTAKAAINNVR